MKPAIQYDVNKRLLAYLLIQWTAVVIATLFLHASSTFFWLINFISFVVLFIRCIRFVSINMTALAMAFLYSGVLSLCLNLKYLEYSLKGIGTSVGIVVVPMYILLFSALDTCRPIDEEKLVKLLKQLSYLGTITMFAAFILSGRNMIGVLLGTLNSYNVSLSGIFYTKNIYGAFVALSLMADILLIKIGNSNRGYWLCLLKIIAVIMSSSRAAMLQMGIAIVIMLILTRRKSIMEWLLIILMMLFVIILFSSNSEWVSILNRNVLKINIGDAGRSGARVRALNVVPNNILTKLFGVGYGGIDYFNVDVDNSYLNQYFSGGIIKMILVGISLAYSFFECIRIRKNNYAIGNMCLAVGMSYIVYAFYESIPILELGITNYCFMLFMYIIPCGYCNQDIIIGED